ncbi:peptidase C14, caspase domain-containing protein [Desarmillaria tabescens]|uniref:Peptidase C14, caspase domain-containing protein n=1 Tax=Armillaria tabescens TaxID=1929756 RepID=A0AA39J2N2_ARMTA|nr:peptidase C14, caspase domain-containing protein [Desarmillaria tabescens]KAK0434171.1 peptidase C14, caspase domain-containing protein [Desarmillaria tabescens]
MAFPPLNEDPAACHSAGRYYIVIGIDAYPTKEDVLRGCVSDATKIFGFLTQNLGIPTDHISLLLGTTASLSSFNRASGMARIARATRANIIEALLGHSTNSQIQKGDNVIIYFSGHGAVYRCKDHPGYGPDSPSSTGTIEALCPMDRRARARGFRLGRSKPIPDISDRELSTILTEISRTKGHHITVILDCCHSGLTRGIQVRGSEAVVCEAKALSATTSIADMFEAADKRLGRLKTDDGSPRYPSISGGDWTPDIPENSHVVLAACQAYEYAAEVQLADNLDSKSERHNGCFTLALISSLKSIIRDPASLNSELPTYV